MPDVLPRPEPVLPSALDSSAQASEAERMASRLRLLHAVTSPSSEPLDARFQRALALTTTLLGMDLGIISHIKGSTFLVEHGYSENGGIAAGDVFDLDETYCSLALEHDGVFAVDHMGSSAHRGHVCYNTFGKESYIGTAITTGGELYGTLCFSSDTEARFTEADHDLLRVLSAWVSRSLEEDAHQRELTEQAALVQGLYDVAPLMMGVVELVDDGTDVLYYSDNAASAARSGTTAEAQRGQRVSESGVSRRVLGLWTDAYRRADATAAPASFEYEDEDGDSPASIWASVVRIAEATDEHPARFCYIAMDVTEKNRAARALATSERRSAVLSEATFEGIAFSRNGIILDVNRQFADMMGFGSPSDALGVEASSIVAPESADLVLTMIAEGREEPYEAQLLRPDGSAFWAEIQGQMVPYVDEEDARVTAVRDITRRKAAEAQTRFQANVLAHVSDAVVALDLDGVITYWNAGAERLHGLPATSVMGRPLHMVVRYHVPPDDPDADLDEATLAPDARDALRDAAGALGDLFYETPGGERRVVSVSASLLRGDAGEERGVLAVLRDVTATRDLAARMRHQARHDSLTGLPNRARFRTAVEAAIDGGEPFSVLYLDLDRFKAVNDTFGHDAGDRLLVAVGERMRGIVRRGGLVARLGGDEFGVVAPGMPDEAPRLADRLLAALNEPITVGAREVVPLASVGVVARAGRYADAEALLRDADTAMYESKRAGRARVTLFDAAMQAAVDGRLVLERDLRTALAEDQLCIHLQPIVDLRTGAVAGFESLVRWQHPARGIIGPAEFLPLAEEAGLVAEIDAFVLDASCREAGRWPELRDGLVMVSVNCSDQSFIAAGLAARARAAAEAAGLPASSLTLELTERAFVETGAARHAVDEIRANGLRVYVDDFGSGYSSLGLLHRLPVDGLKIDRSFVTDLASSTSAQAVVRAVVQFSSDLGLRTVAEGIETPEQLAHLRTMGCSYGQGFLFSYPVPPAEARAMIGAPPWAGLWPA